MRIGHVHLKVKNLGRSEKFYCDLLGASITERIAGQYSFLSMGEAHHEIALQELGDYAKNPSRDMIGLYHSAFEVEDSKELLEAIKQLEELKSDYSLVDHGISWAVYTSDPDGNGVEVYLDRRKASSGTTIWNGKSRGLSIEEIKKEF